MAAHDHLGEQFFHYTDAELSSGDEVLPAQTLGVTSRFADVPKYSPRRVYMVKGDHDPMVYEQYGQRGYEVEPMGRVARDPERAAGASHWRAPKARVVRQHKP